MIPKKTKIYFIIISVLLFLILISFTGIWFLANNHSSQKYFLKRISNTTEYVINADNIKLGFEKGITISADNISITPHTKSTSILISKIKFIFTLKEIIPWPVIQIETILFQPDLAVFQSKNKNLKPYKIKDFINTFENSFIKHGHLLIQDGRISTEEPHIKIESIDLNLSPITEQPDNFTANASFNVEYKNEKTPFFLQGSIIKDEPEKKYSLKMRLKTKKTPLNWIPAAPLFEIKGGYAFTDIKFAADTDGKVEFNGNIAMENLSFQHKTDSECKNSLFPELTADFQAYYANNIFRISTSKIKAPDFSLSVGFQLDMTGTTDINLTLTSEFMSLKSLKKTFPTPAVDPWIKDSFLPVFNTGQVRYDLFAIHGTPDQLSNLDLPENKNRLILKLSLREMEILKGENNLPFTQTSGKVCIKNNSLIVSGVHGVFGESIIKNASYSINNLSADDKSHEFMINGGFALSDLKKQGNIYFTPAVIKKELDKFTVFNGHIDSSIRLHYMSSWEYPKIQKLKFQFNNCNIYRNDLLLPVFIDEASMKMDTNNRGTLAGKGSWGNSQFSISGTGRENWETGQSEIEFFADLNEIAEIIYKNNKLNFNSLIPCHLLLTKEKKRCSWQGEIDLSEIPIPDNSSAPSFNNRKTVKNRISFSGNTLPDKKIALKNITLYKDGSSLNLSGVLDMKKNILSNLKVDANPLLLKDINYFLKPGYNRVSGKVLCHITMDVPFSDLSGIKISGRANGENISFFSDQPSTKITDCNFNIDFSENHISASPLNFQLQDSLFTINGRVKGWDGLKGSVNISSDYVNFTDLDFSGLKRGNRKFTQFINKSDLTINMFVKKGLWKTIDFAPLTLQSNLKADVFNINQFDIQMEKGSLLTYGHIKIGEKPNFFFKSEIKLLDFPAEKFIDALNLEKRVKIHNALISTKGFLTVHEIYDDEFLSGLSGKFNFILENGVIEESNLIFTILNLLSLNNIIDEDKFNFTQKGFTFKEIAGEIEIENGVLKSQNVLMRSPVFDAAGRGEINLVKEKINIDIGIAPLGTIDRCLNIIPIAGYILTGDDKSFITFYIKAKGPLKEYKVRYVPLKHWPKGIFGFIKRTLFSPVHLLKQINEMEKIILKKETDQPVMEK